MGVSGKEGERPDHHRERWREKKGKGNMEKREIEEDIGRHGAGSCQNIPYWKNDVLGLGMMGRK